MAVFARIFERFVAFRRIPMRVVIITALASYVLQLGAILQGQPLYIIALLTLIPWIPLAFFEGLWKYEHYSWIAVFAVVTALQVGHLGEHTFQVTQLQFLNGTIACPPPVDNAANAQRAVAAGLRTADQGATGYSASNVVMPNSQGQPVMRDGRQVVGPPACGVFGQLDFETIHLVWDTLVWIGSLFLLLKFPRNGFLWLAMIAASVHEIEHLFIGWVFFVEKEHIYRFTRTLWATTADGAIVTATPVGTVVEATNFYEAGGLAGIMARNGMAQWLLFNTTGDPNGIQLFRRPILHFGYNTVVVIPTLLGFFWQSRKVYNQYLAKALPTLSEDQLVSATPRLERLTFDPGMVIVKQGDPADKFYIITKGQVEVLRQGPNGQEVGVSRLGVGQYFGEIGLLHGGKRIATVRAADEVEVLALDRDTFSGLMDESDVSRQELDRIVRQRVMQTRALQGSGD